MRKLQVECRAKRQKVLKSVAEASTLANKLLGSIGAHMSMAKRATLSNSREELKVESKTMKGKQNETRKAMAGHIIEHAKWRKSGVAAKQSVAAQTKKILEDLAHKLDTPRNLFKVRENKLVQ